MRKLRLLLLLTLFTSTWAHLSWGENQHQFLWQTEWELLQKLFRDPVSVIHPLTLLPLFGQLLLLLSLLKNKPNSFIIYLGIACLGLLYGLLLLIAFLTLNPLSIMTVFPFWIGAIFLFRETRKLGRDVKK